MYLKLEVVLCILICVAGISSVDIDSTQGERDVSSDATTDAQTRVKRTLGIDESYEREYELKTKKGTTLTVKKSIKYNDGGAIVHLPTMLDSLADAETKVIGALKKKKVGSGASASASASASAAAAHPQVVVLHEVEQVPVPVPVVQEPVFVHEEPLVAPHYAYGKKQTLRDALPLVKLGHQRLLSGERRGLLKAYRKSASGDDNDLLHSRSAAEVGDVEDAQRAKETETETARAAKQPWSETEAALIGKLSMGLAKLAQGKKIGPPCCPDGPCCPHNYEH